MILKLMFIGKPRHHHTPTSIENEVNKKTDAPPQVAIANIPGFPILKKQSQQKDKRTTTR